MEKQKTVNSLAHDDDFSKALMESYTAFLGGDGFQNSTIKEEEIPTGQKQGGTAFASFDTPIGSVPAPAEDSSTGIPTIEKQKPDDGSTKDPKATSNGGEPAVALKGSMTMGQGSMSGGVPQTNGQAINYTNVVAKEAAECCKKCGSYKHTTEECKATKEEIENYLWDEHARILTELSELTKTTFKVTGEKWETDEKPVSEEQPADTQVIGAEVMISNSDEKAHNLEEWKKAAKKKADKIMGYVK